MRISRDIPRLFFAALAGVLWPAFCGADDGYLSELTARSRELNLSRDRYWHLLMHYRPRWIAGVKSEADGTKFFNAPHGKTDPRAELEATLERFFDPPDPRGNDDAERQHPQCKFPGRYRWLKAELGFDPQLLPEVSCELFEEWKKAMDSESMTIIFASFYMNNPASMFGHTLIRFDQGGERGKHDLLDYAVNYAANTGPDPGFLFAVRGLVGSYDGTFSTYPYYFKVREYNDFESRDIWEYRLRFTREQISPVLAHLWELGGTYFDYFFFDENCSYHLMSLLGIADPSFTYTDHRWFFVSPSDTVKIVSKDTDFIVSTTYRPSIRSQLFQKWALLNGEERQVFRKIAEKKNPTGKTNLAGFSAERRALVLDTALTYFDFLRAKKPQTEFEREILKERSRLGDSPPVPNTELSTSPTLGHESSMVGLSFGRLGSNWFEELRLRPAFHDLLSSDDGHPDGAQITGLEPRLRFYHPANKVHLEKFTAINVVSLAPWDALFKKLSWNVEFGADTLHNRSCAGCNVGYLNGGAGVAIESRVFTKEMFYVLVNLLFQGGPSVPSNYRLGPMATGGLFFDFAPFWRMQVSGTYDYAPVGKSSYDYRAELNQRFSMTRDMELRLEARKYRVGAEALLAFQAYF